jgi:tetratricopeptide (TPR) repeat protein
MNMDDEYALVSSKGTVLKIMIPAKKRGNSQYGEKSEGTIRKLFYLFRKEKWRAQAEIQNYLEQIKKEPGNTKARLKLADLYRKKGEAEKAIAEYLRAAEICWRKALYPQAMAIYKGIQKQNLSSEQVNLKMAEIYRKRGLFSDARSQYEHLLRHYNRKGMEDKAMQALVLMAELSSEEIAAEKKIQMSKEFGEFQEAESGNRGRTDITEVVLPEGGKEEICFDLGAELEAGESRESKVFKEVKTDKIYGFEEILREMKVNSALSEDYPNFNYSMGALCREMGFIDEAIEQFQIAWEKGQNPFEAAHLLGLSYRERSCWNEARQSFEKALTVEGISHEKILKVKNELALIALEKKGEEEADGLSSESPVGGQELRLLYRSQNQKKKTETIPLGRTQKVSKELSV